MYHERGEYNGKKKDNSVCSSYRKHSTDCTGHFIRTEVLRELVLMTLRTVSGYARENEKDFIRMVTDAAGAQHEGEVKVRRKKLSSAQKRSVELDAIIKRL